MCQTLTLEYTEMFTTCTQDGHVSFSDYLLFYFSVFFSCSIASSDGSGVRPHRMSIAHKADMTIRYVELDFTEKICSRLAWRGLGKLQILVWVPLSDSQPDVTQTTTSGQKGYYTLT